MEQKPPPPAHRAGGVFVFPPETGAKACRFALKVAPETVGWFHPPARRAEQKPLPAGLRTLSLFWEKAWNKSLQLCAGGCAGEGGMVSPLLRRGYGKGACAALRPLSAAFASSAQRAWQRAAKRSHGRAAPPGALNPDFRAVTPAEQKRRAAFCAGTLFAHCCNPLLRGALFLRATPHVGRA